MIQWYQSVPHFPSFEKPTDCLRVFLHATDESALDSITIEQLKKYAADGETSGAGGGAGPRGIATAIPERLSANSGVSSETHKGGPQSQQA
jgi:hypothetical protein